MCPRQHLDALDKAGVAGDLPQLMSVGAVTLAAGQLPEGHPDGHRCGVLPECGGDRRG
jgi:hypothetical protein